MSEYFPILLLFGIALAFAAGSIGVSMLVGPTRPNPTKLDAYECGNEPLARVRDTRFSVKFYLVAMMFLIFDVEAVFLFPWAVILGGLDEASRVSPTYALVAMFLFIVTLLEGLGYAWKKGVLKWE